MWLAEKSAVFWQHSAEKTYSISSPFGACRDLMRLHNPIPEINAHPFQLLGGRVLNTGKFVWDQFGIRTSGIMRVSVCLGAIRIPECLDFNSGYSAPGSWIARIYSGTYSYSGISSLRDFVEFIRKSLSEETKLYISFVSSNRKVNNCSLCGDNMLQLAVALTKTSKHGGANHLNISSGGIYSVLDSRVWTRTERKPQNQRIN